MKLNSDHEYHNLNLYLLGSLLQFRYIVLATLAADFVGAYIIDRILQFLFGHAHLRQS